VKDALAPGKERIPEYRQRPYGMLFSVEGFQKALKGFAPIFVRPE
jgi:hypothetical protein